MSVLKIIETRKVMNMQGWTGHDEEIDWENSGNNALPEGVYNLKVVKAEPRPTKDGKPSVGLELLIESSSSGARFNNRKVFDTITISAAAAFKVKQVCKALDVCPPRSGAFGDVEEFAKSLLDEGRNGVSALLKQDTYDGQTRNKVKQYLHADEVDKVAAKFPNA